MGCLEILRASEVYQEHEREHGRDSTFLVHCQAGVNRSALAASVILWKLGLYESVDEMLGDMRMKQRAQRDYNLLSNGVFDACLREWVAAQSEE